QAFFEKRPAKFTHQ
ncbi:hypothetical protein, partial [Acinetobacter pseudolwoffii]